MRSQNLLANNESPETITMKFEHCSVIQIQIGKTFHVIYLTADS